VETKTRIEFTSANAYQKRSFGSSRADLPTRQTGRVLVTIVSYPLPESLFIDIRCITKVNSPENRMRQSVADRRIGLANPEVLARKVRVGEMYAPVKATAREFVPSLFQIIGWR